jgi:arylsulfatase A-like enzyme
MLFARVAIAFCVLLALCSAASGGAAPRPNVVLIVCDDLNDWVEPLGGHPLAQTPSLAAFARTGVTFTCAHSNNPVCAPSRASFLTGIYPHTSGNLFWDKWYENPVLRGSKTIMGHFRDNGYRVVGSGKLMHHARKNEWDEFPHAADYGPLAWDGARRVAHPGVAEPFRSIGAIDGSFGSLADVPFADVPLVDGGHAGGAAAEGAGWIFGGWGRVRPFRYDGPEDRDRTPDEAVAQWAARRLERFSAEGGGPFFLGVGLIRPHTPMHAPQAFFDRFPLDGIVLPAWLAGDAEDTRHAEHFGPEQKGRRYFRLIAESYGGVEAGLARFARAYLACTAFADAQIGVVLDALERTGLDENTVVVITSDHGFAIGEKSYLFKNAPWDASTRVPLLIRAPGVSVAGGRAASPVSLIDLYPTLVDLCGLTGDTRKNGDGRPLDGHSLRPLLADPARGAWGGPPAALTMVHAGEDATRALSKAEAVDPASQHWSVRTARYRYVRYNTGAAELYDHADDPNEWRNLADAPAHAATLARMDALLRDLLAPVRLGPNSEEMPESGPPGG